MPVCIVDVAYEVRQRESCGRCRGRWACLRLYELRRLGDVLVHVLDNLGHLRRLPSSRVDVSILLLCLALLPRLCRGSPLDELKRLELRPGLRGRHDRRTGYDVSLWREVLPMVVGKAGAVAVTVPLAVKMLKERID